MKTLNLILSILFISNVLMAQCIEGDCQEGFGIFKSDELIVPKNGEPFRLTETYSGFFKEGKMHGVGIIESSDGLIFKGAFVDGKKNGVGILTMVSKNLTQYAEYEDDQLNGYSFAIMGGKLREACKYKKDKFQKDLSVDYNSGIKGSGCLGNCVNAFGLKVYDDSGNNHYTGFFWAELQQFIGTRQFASGDKYSGAMKKSDRQGFGEYKWASGGVYMGEWNKNEMHGVGMFIEADGTEKFGIFKKGKFVESLRK